MGLVSGIVVYLITWWTLLFAVLPWGAERAADTRTEVKGHTAPVPKSIKLGQKFLITSVLSAAIWVIIYILIEIDIVDFRDIANHMSIR